MVCFTDKLEKHLGEARTLDFKWSIAMYRGVSPFNLQPIEPGLLAMTPEQVTDIPCSAVADPFLLRRGDRWYMFFEAWNKDRNLGEIAFASSPDLLRWEYGAVVMREPFHLSYPQIFEHEGTVYMVPETRQAGAIRLYAAAGFPEDWRLVSVLAEGQYADATLFLHEGKWRMFAQRGLDELRLFHSDRLESGWTGHPSNPFWPANRTYCRPGGRVLAYEGDLYRLAQDGLESYGKHLRAMRIERLNDVEFAEREIAQSPILSATGKGWNGVAMHHLDAVEVAPGEWLAVVDGATHG